MYPRPLHQTAMFCCNRIAFVAACMTVVAALQLQPHLPQLDRAYDIYRRMRLCVPALRFPPIPLTETRGIVAVKTVTKLNKDSSEPEIMKQFHCTLHKRQLDKAIVQSLTQTTLIGTLSSLSPLYQASISSPKHTNHPHPHPNQLTFLLPSNQKE